jgi:hypothetical protein
MQWRIINDRRPVLSWTADKLAEKEYARRALAAAQGLTEVKIPQTYWAGSDVDELREASSKFPGGWAFKPNHSSGRYRLFSASQERSGVPDWEELKRLAHAWVRRDEESTSMGHWAYSQARIGMIAEERIGGSERPTEVRVVCYNGRIDFIRWQHGFGTTHEKHVDFNADFRAVNVGQGSQDLAWAADITSRLSAQLRREIVGAAEALSAPFDFVRVDLYVSSGTVWFGELTPYSTGGLMVFSAENDLARGALWRLPNLRSPDLRANEWAELLEQPLRSEFS